MEKMKLTELIELVKQNDEEAFRELYRRYHRLVFYVAYQITKNHADAEEVVQEAFVQVTRSIDSLKDPEQFKSWIGRIAYTKAITLLRKNRDQQMSDQQLEILSNQTESRWDYCPEQKSRHDGDMRALQECIAKLKLPYREVLTLYYFAQMNIKEIAELTNNPEGTVKSRLLYGKQYLREEVERYEQTNQVKLDFHASTLEAMLVSAAATLSVEPQGVSLLSFRKFNRTQIIQTAASLAVSVGLLYGGYTLVTDHRAANDHFDDSYQETQTFPLLSYEQESIHTPREAYTLLMKKAHCEVEIAQLNASQLSQIEQIYQALDQYGGVYHDLLITAEWDKLYHEMIIK